MTIRHAAALVAMCLLFGLTTSRDAHAQTGDALQLGAGYQFLHESVERGGESFPVGLYVDVEQPFARDSLKTWGWMGQFEGGFRSDSGFSEQLYTFLGGLRLGSARPGRWTPSGFGLIGLATVNASCEEFCAGTAGGVAVQGGFTMTTRMNPSTLLDLTFKASKLRIHGDGVFNVAIAGGVRFNLR